MCCTKIKNAEQIINTAFVSTYPCAYVASNLLQYNKKCSAFSVEYPQEQDGLWIKLARNKSLCNALQLFLIQVHLYAIYLNICCQYYKTERNILYRSLLAANVDIDKHLVHQTSLKKPLITKFVWYPCRPHFYCMKLKFDIAIFQLYHMATSLVVEEAGVPGENHRPWASNW
jgi:hypothetical protein